MDREVRARLKWVTTYEETGDAGLTCRRCGISRPTLRKWWRRYKAEGLDGLRSRSRRPKSSPQQRVFAEQEAWMTCPRKLGQVNDAAAEQERHRFFGMEWMLEERGKHRKL